MKNKSIIRIGLVTGLILLIPLIAMQFTDEVTWEIGDFVVMGALLFGAGMAYEMLARRGNTTAYRVSISVAIAVVFLLIWMELAVGIFGSPWAGS